MSAPTGPGSRIPAKSWAFLLPAFGGLAASVVGVWLVGGWDDALWVLWLGLFAVFEGHGLASETAGDTLSEKTREWLHTKTLVGRWGFFAMLGTSVAWFAWHIVGEV